MSSTFNYTGSCIKSNLISWPTYLSLNASKHVITFNLTGDSILEVNFDPRYALTVCQEAEHDQACVRLYSIQGLHEEAVDLALKTDIDLAKSMANKPKENESMCKKLWLKIGTCTFTSFSHFESRYQCV